MTETDSIIKIWGEIGFGAVVWIIAGDSYNSWQQMHFRVAEVAKYTPDFKFIRFRKRGATEMTDADYCESPVDAQFFLEGFIENLNGECHVKYLELQDSFVMFPSRESLQNQAQLFERLYDLALELIPD